MNALQDALIEWYEALSEAASVYGALDEKLYQSIIDRMSGLSGHVSKSPLFTGCKLIPECVEPPRYGNGATAIEDGERAVTRLSILKKRFEQLPLSDVEDAGLVRGLSYRLNHIGELVGRLRSHRADLYTRQMMTVLPLEYRRTLLRDTGVTMNIIAQIRGVLVIYEAGVAAEYARAATDMTYLDDDAARRVIDGYRNGVPAEYLRSLE